jgi:hypothetical protein
MVSASTVTDGPDLRPVQAPKAASAERLVAAAPAAAGSGRDPRLDFYRGLAMFLILVAHTPLNAVSAWLPSRWGFSDATEIFVFCSGMASAIAFGASFDRAGWALGAARVGYRLWQVYWAHVGLFFATATMLAAIDHFGGYDQTYIGSLNLWKFFADPGPQLVGLFTLTYVPNYFDVLPMYLVLLAMIPVAVALGRISPLLVAAAVIGVWLMAQGALWEALGAPGMAWSLPAEPWSDREWYFNPFGWQLVFFTGFALMRGWIPAPPVSPVLTGLALAIVLGGFVVSPIASRELGLEAADAWRQAHAGWLDKTDFGMLRWVHFLALAYLAWLVAGRNGHRLLAAGQGAGARAWGAVVRAVSLVGQQSLAVFVFSMAFARIIGFAFERLGVTAGTTLLLNAVGIAALIGVAGLAAFVKRQPWRTKAVRA